MVRPLKDDQRIRPAVHELPMAISARDMPPDEESAGLAANHNRKVSYHEVRVRRRHNSRKIILAQERFDFLVVRDSEQFRDIHAKDTTLRLNFY